MCESFGAFFHSVYDWSAFHARMFSPLNSVTSTFPELDDSVTLLKAASFISFPPHDGNCQKAFLSEISLDLVENLHPYLEK